MSQNNKKDGVTFDFVVGQLQLLKLDMIAEHITQTVTLEQGKVPKWLKLSSQNLSANQVI